MGKLKRHLLTSNYRYFDKTFTKIFLEKACITYVFLAHCLFSLVAMKTKMQTNMKKNIKNISSETICAMRLWPHGIILHISVHLFFCSTPEPKDKLGSWPWS